MCLLVGSPGSSKDRYLFEYVLWGQMDDQLWYFLKLASFQRQVNVFDDYVEEVYSLSDLRAMLLGKGRSQFSRSDCTDEVNSARYARILFLAGSFNLALEELECADYLVEASMLALVLRELGLISTKQRVLSLLGEETVERQLLRE